MTCNLISGSDSDKVRARREFNIELDLFTGECEVTFYSTLLEQMCLIKLLLDFSSTINLNIKTNRLDDLQRMK